MNREYRMCTNCVMDTTDPKITFNEEGVCTHCRRLGIFHPGEVMTLDYNNDKADKIVGEIKEAGKDNKYDCILGLSGGVDSTYLAYQAIRLGLRPLCVHLDNGWNSEIAVRNIERIVKKGNFDLYTHVINWHEFKDFQLSFFKASVVDIEMLTDHAIIATLYRLADKNNTRFILRGWNRATENTMPFLWNYIKMDALNIVHIHHLFGSVKLNTFPVLDHYRFQHFTGEKNIQCVFLLNRLKYIKKDVIDLLQRFFGWEYYGDKHYESIFTRFYQGYILPVKFNIDKRKAHLSSLVHSGQITREYALEELKKELYEPAKLKEDKTFVLKKLGLSDTEFEEIMKLPVKSHTDYLAGHPPRK